MDTVIIEIMKRQSDWFFFATSLIILAGLGAGAYWMILATKRYADSIGRENRLISLQDEFIEMRDSNQKHADSASQLYTAMRNANSFISTLNQIRTNNDSTIIAKEAFSLVEQVIHAMASDVKSRSGELHRCALWLHLPESNHLNFHTGSIGFPDEYSGPIGRKLEINRSIAGKCFLRKEKVVIPDVSKDSDWIENPSSTNKYKSIIALPVSNVGVITLDAQFSVDDEKILISEMYSDIIIGAYLEFRKASLFHSSNMETAATDDGINNQEE